MLYEVDTIKPCLKWMCFSISQGTIEQLQRPLIDEKK